jgi:hypothetical protein
MFRLHYLYFCLTPPPTTSLGPRTNRPGSRDLGEQSEIDEAGLVSSVAKRGGQDGGRVGLEEGPGDRMSERVLQHAGAASTAESDSAVL